MFIRTAKHEAIVADLKAKLSASRAVVEAISSECTSLKQNNYALDRTASKYKAERDAARAQLQPFLDRQEKAKRNLRQFRPAPEPERLPPLN